MVPIINPHAFCSEISMAAKYTKSKARSSYQLTSDMLDQSIHFWMKLREEPLETLVRDQLQIQVPRYLGGGLFNFVYLAAIDISEQKACGFMTYSIL